MKKLSLTLCVCLLNACAVQSKPDLETTVANHTVILGAIAEYIGQLQEGGVLPKPIEKKD